MRWAKEPQPARPAKQRSGGWQRRPRGTMLILRKRSARAEGATLGGSLARENGALPIRSRRYHWVELEWPGVGAKKPKSIHSAKACLPPSPGSRVFVGDGSTAHREGNGGSVLAGAGTYSSNSAGRGPDRCRVLIHAVYPTAVYCLSTAVPVSCAASWRGPQARMNA